MRSALSITPRRTPAGANHGKLTSSDQFQNKGRGIQGCRCQHVTSKTGLLASVAAVSVDDDILVMTNEGMVIRMYAFDISEFSRTAAGVKIMRLNEGAKIVGFSPATQFKEEEEEQSDIEKVDEIIENMPELQSEINMDNE